MQVRAATTTTFRLACSCLAPQTARSTAIASLTLARRTLATAVDVLSPAIEGEAPVPSTSAAPPVASSSSSPRIPDFSQSRRAPLPSTAETAGQPVYLPNLVFRLVRNGPKERNNPFIATFRVPLGLTKPDIVSYLDQVYGLEVTSIATIIEMGDIKRVNPGGYKTDARAKSTKKAIVGLKEPFWWPERRSEKWLNENFEKNQRTTYLKRRLLPVGDASLGRGKRSWRWRGSDVHEQGVGARYSEIIQRIKDRRTQQERIVGNLVAKEKEELAERVKGLEL